MSVSSASIYSCAHQVRVRRVTTSLRPYASKDAFVLAIILMARALAPVNADQTNGDTYQSFDLNTIKQVDEARFCDLFAKNQLCMNWSDWGLGQTCSAVSVDSIHFCQLADNGQCKVDDSSYASYDNILHVAAEMPKFATNCFSTLTPENCEAKDGCSYRINTEECVMPHDAVVQFYDLQKIPSAAYMHTYYKNSDDWCTAYDLAGMDACDTQVGCAWHVSNYVSSCQRDNAYFVTKLADTCGPHVDDRIFATILENHGYPSLSAARQACGPTDCLEYCTSCEMAMVRMGLFTMPCEPIASGSGSADLCDSGTGAGSGSGSGSGSSSNYDAGFTSDEL